MNLLSEKRLSYSYLSDSMGSLSAAFFNGDKKGILKRAKITEGGKLTERFSYLQDYVDGK